MFENIINFFKRAGKKEEKKETANSKDAAKERLHLVLMQDRANVSADFLELMKQEIIEVIKKYIEVDEKAIDVRLTNKENEDGTNGAPALYANIPILNIKNEARKVDKKEIKEQVDKKEEEKTVEKETHKQENKNNENIGNKEEKGKEESTINDLEQEIEEKNVEKQENAKEQNSENSEEKAQENENTENIEHQEKEQNTQKVEKIVVESKSKHKQKVPQV